VRSITLAIAGAVSASLCASLCASLAAAQSARLAHTWRPLRAPDGEVDAIAVHTELTAAVLPADGRLSLSVPVVYPGAPGIADRTDALRMQDANGNVPLDVTDDAAAPGGFPYYRHFRTARAVTLPLTYSYRSRVPRTAPRGPPFGLLAAFDGVSGAGAGFLVLPELVGSATQSVRWDLSAMRTGARAATSFGDGDFTISGDITRLRDGWLMAGTLGSAPTTSDSVRLKAYWLGEPAWDAELEMRWTAQMYDWLGKAYGTLTPLPPYRVFIRVGTWRGGTALDNSFLVSAPPRGDTTIAFDGPRETITHELGHLFVGQIDAPDGISSWFTEGLNVYYTRLLPMRGGFITVEEYGRQVNAAFTDYWRSPARNLSADSITRIGFADDEVRHMPYVRGSLYFADLDARIRRRSRGRRSLDTMVRELFRRRSAGTPITHASWIAAVRREAGPHAPAMFEHVILRGDRSLIPESDAFGPCFTRRTVPEGPAQDGARAYRYEWVRTPFVPDDACRSPF
jgi:hypothetical protein